MRVELPDHIVGIGGSGCKVVEGLMQREWILQSAIEQSVERDTTFDAWTIDSATGTNERNARLEAAADIEALCDAIAADHGVGDRSTIDVSFAHYNYVEEWTDEDGELLANEGYVRGTLLDELDRLENCWWLKDHPDLLTDGFENGVVRRRALGKALYHASKAHSDTHPAEELNVDNHEQVVIVTALGGGTGSGSFLDLAADINPDASIHLFAIMPDAGSGDQPEGSDELANAHAALSELEFLELTNDSPFTSITLIPYHERDDIVNKDFEDAVVHTILAHQFAMSTPIPKAGTVPGGGRYTLGVLLVPGRNWAISDLNTFNVAVPRILRYDTGIRHQARNEIEAYLDERKDQLDLERRLYETVKQYLEANFGGSFDSRPDDDLSDVDPERDENEYRLIEMSHRLEEQLQGQLLEDESLRAAGLGPAVDYLVERFATAYGEQFDLQLDDGQQTPVYTAIDEDERYSPDYATDLLGGLAGQVLEDLEDGFESFDDELERTLLRVVRQDIHNVWHRYHLLRGIWDTDAEAIDGLDSHQVEKLKTALTDTVLDPESQGLSSTFPDNDVRRLEEDLRNELLESEVALAQLDLFEDHLTSQLRERIAGWERTVADEFDTVVTYHQTREELTARLGALDAVCKRIAERLSGDNPPETASKIRFRIADTEVDTDALNELFARLGIDTHVDESRIREDIRALIQAREAYEQYHGGWGPFPLFDGRYRETFETAAVTVNEDGSGAFRLSPNIEEAFHVEYVGDYTERIERVDQRYAVVVETLTDELEAQLYGGDEGVERFEVEDVVDREEAIERVQTNGGTGPAYVERPGNEEHHPAPDRVLDHPVPESDQQVAASLDELEDHLRSLSPGAIEDREGLERELGVFITDEDVVDREKIDGRAVTQLFESYFEPVWTSQEELRSELDRLGSGYVSEENDGLWQAVARLVRLADGDGGSSVETVELASANHEVVDGFEFAMEFEWDNYEIETSETSPEKNNPLVRTREATYRDLTDDPRHIGESNIWEHNEDMIKMMFKRHVDHLLNDLHNRLGVDLSHLVPPTGVEEYQELRMVNTYLSREFETTNSGPTAGFEEVSQSVTDSNTYRQFFDDNDGYTAQRIGCGDEWTLSMVTFVSAFSLDQLEPLVGDTGYRESYEWKHNEATYPWRNHMLGVAGEWDRWEALADRVREDGEPDWWPSGGAYIWRDEFREPGEICAMTKRLSEYDPDISRVDAKEELLSLYNVDQFESTIEGGSSGE